MTPLPSIIDQSDAMLARLASLDLTAAEHVHACLLETIEPGEVAELSRGYGRLSRSVRQTLALLAKLKADRARAEREAAQHEGWLAARAADRHPPERDLRDLAVEERAEALQDAVGRVISAASGDDRARHADFAHRFDREMDDWTERDDFVDEDLGEHVRRACRLLGLPEDLAARWQDLPEPTFFPDPAPESQADGPSPDGTAEDQAAPPIPWASSA